MPKICVRVERVRSWMVRAAALIGIASIPAAVQPQPLPARSQTGALTGAEQRVLQQRITELGRAFPGEVGIAVRDIESGAVAAWNGNRLFPQQSVSKFWVALAAFDAIDRGRLSLDRRITVRRGDLTLFHQPIRALVDADGYTTTLSNLLERSITQSDCTANDVVLWQAGGPQAVRALIASHRISGVRFGPGERLMQSAIAGVTWNQSMSIGNGFERARALVPMATRRRLFDAYVENPIDGASPNAMTDALARLQRGELLSPGSTQRLLAIMARTRTGRTRLAGGLAPGWSLAHKTGTGQQLGGEQAGYNDVGIITAPDGRRYAVAVLIGRTSTPNAVRMRLMQNVTRAAIAYHEARRGGGSYAGNRVAEGSTAR
jgi:beta-lactamase class A